MNNHVSHDQTELITTAQGGQIDVYRDKILLAGTQVMGVTVLLVFAWVMRNVLQPKIESARRSLALPVEIERTINTILGRILAETEASRVLVAQFHNGQNYYGGYSYSKLTVTHEAISPGVGALSFNLKEIPLSLYAEDLEIVKQSPTKYAFITPESFTNPRSSGVSKQRMLRMGIDGYYCFLLRGNVNKEDCDIGAVFLQYNSLERVHTINARIEELVATIESYIVPSIESRSLSVRVFDALGSMLARKQ